MANFSKALQGGRSRAPHIVAHGTHGALLGFALGSALLDDGGIMMHELLVVDLRETLSSEVQCNSSAEGWGGGHG